MSAEEAEGVVAVVESIPPKEEESSPTSPIPELELEPEAVLAIPTVALALSGS